jgi:hypothetical protein
MSSNTSSSSSSNNKWGVKFMTNFSALTTTSSKESIQTFVQWIYFNRKHKANFISAFQAQVGTTSTAHSAINDSIYSILLTVLHEVFILHHGGTAPEKWDLASELRISLGESLLLEYALLFPDVTKLETYVQQWETCNAFGDPTIIRQLRTKLLSSRTASSTITSNPTIATKPVSTVAVQVVAGGDVANFSADSVEAPNDTAEIKVESENNDTNERRKVQVPIPETLKDPDVVMDEAITTNATTAVKTASVSNREEEEDVLLMEEAPAAATRRIRTKAKQSNDDDDDDVVIVEKEKDDFDVLMNPNESRTTAAMISAKTSPSSSSSATTKFDFEASGIPATKVQAQEFLEPCRLIATLQIARDLRNDSAVQISSLLQSLPESVRAMIADAAESDDSASYVVPDETAREFCTIINDQLLDMNMDDQLENVTTFMDLIDRQRKARQTIYELLVGSRCQFGAQDVAETYYSINDTILKQRAQILADAMDLEGLEVQPINPAISAMVELEKELVPFKWYNTSEVGAGDDDVSNKRQKI